MSLIFYILIFTAWLSGIGVNGKWSSFIEGDFAYVVILVLILFALSLASFREAGWLESNQREELGGNYGLSLPYAERPSGK